ncbi:hypothetical protein BIW11_05527 [Tropilaelaps mercedesae]|uniref:Uncharacterized protein n=1 Tax=Tropilaelaps mercedesae TaxID=418985 RepID=A0A1V9Y1X1_9ACAR|nr:hypothetical protein BIW11_05527 [Tropilaelaps mercedesae]
MCDDFETTESMPLEKEVRGLMEERRASRASDNTGSSQRAERRGSQIDRVFVEDFAGNITAKTPEDVIKRD